MESLPNTIRVKLVKRRQGGLGFLVKQRKEKPYVVISDLIAGSVAWESCLVHVGDIILSVNDINISSMSYEHAVRILKAVPYDATIVLLLRGPSGYMTHLQTVFKEDGTPCTIRISQPVPEKYREKLKTRPRHLGVGNGGQEKSASLPRSLSPFQCLTDGKTGRNSLLSRSSRSLGRSVSFAGSDYEDESDIESDLYKSKSSTDVDTNTLLKTAREFDENHTVFSENVDEGENDSDTLLEKTSPSSPKIILTKPDNENSRNLECKESIFHGALVKKKEKNKKGLRLDSLEKRSTEQLSLDDANDLLQSKVNNLKIRNEISNKAKAAKATNRSRRSQSSPRQSKTEDSADELNRKRSSSEHGRTRKSPSSPKNSYVRVKNWADEKLSAADKLHINALENVHCTPDKCLGSFMSPPPTRPPGVPRSRDEMLHHAKDFLDQYYASIKRLNKAAHLKRWREVSKSIEETGTYELTHSELTFGAKTAWRNAPRCLGRIQWSKLQVFDARRISTTREMFEAICNHMKYATNKGNLRSSVTVFPPRTDGKHDFRVWNSQLIRYAGYRQPDGTIIGDPANAELTEVCIRMGWKPKYGMFDVLPLVLSANGEDPDMFEIPPDLVLEVPLKHPKFPWFADLGLKWYALPAVSSMMLDLGGLEFTGCPFNGWYMGTEIGARNLCDTYRYSILETIATRMGLDTKKTSSLWKDRALVEVNISVLHSYQLMNVTIVDHHQLSESFMKHLENEQKLRGGCPGDWVWLVPPISGSTTPIFHQEMLNYQLKPSYEYQVDPWKVHVWNKGNTKGVLSSKDLKHEKRKFSFREIARAVKFSAKLMGKALARRVKCSILFATETGKSERYARMLCEVFRQVFDAKVVCMDNYDIMELEHEALVIFVTSTFGNGDPPENGVSFGKNLFSMRSFDDSKEMSTSSYLEMTHEKSDQIGSNKTTNGLTEGGPLANVRYGVFALGSKAYPNFCAFGHFVDRLMAELGGERIYKLQEGDELCGQEESYTSWAKGIFQAACDTFCVGDDISIGDATGALSNSEKSWSPGKFKLTILENVNKPDICKALSKSHNKTTIASQLLARDDLQAPESSRETILVKLDTRDCPELAFTPGDHIGIFPVNSPDLVDALLARLHNAPPADQMVKVEYLQEKQTPFGKSKDWIDYDGIPPCTLRMAFERFVDITTPPTPMLLQHLKTLASRESDKQYLERLTKDSSFYEQWKYDKTPNIVEVLEECPSVRVAATLLLSQLPLLQQRFYSISSSPKLHPSEIDITVAVVEYRTQGGAGPLHRGVCSNWLNQARIGETIPCFIRQAHSFHLPGDPTLPIIMVGPGTGIAPFRSFWQQRKVDREMQGKLNGWGRMTLYFGCRESNVDQLYKDEIEEAQRSGVLHAVYTAFSRETGTPKTYVQDILKRNKIEVYDTIHRKSGHFYVCGDVSMAADVTETLVSIIQSEGKLSADEAKDYLLRLRDTGRFHEDIFGVTLHVRDRIWDKTKQAQKYISEAGKVAKKSMRKENIAPILTNSVRKDST
ncbi:nitric oxide synthase, salivary gland-like [Tubulanus polymorphus]|uniref:nitric oxide synthase, salivary gland-like n=1 Tax=Tubulanus polymorphus TaxID=672921 RepID=UPI003DA551DA